MILGEENVNKMIDSIFKSCGVERDCEYVDYNSDQIFLVKDKELTYLIWYKFTGYDMEWKLYRIKDMEFLGEGVYDTEHFFTTQNTN